jgi:hypothetical protein
MWPGLESESDPNAESLNSPRQLARSAVILVARPRGDGSRKL